MNKPEAFKVFFPTRNSSFSYNFRGFDSVFLPIVGQDEPQWHQKDRKGRWAPIEASWDVITGFEYTGEVLEGTVG